MREGGPGRAASLPAQKRPLVKVWGKKLPNAAQRCLSKGLEKLACSFKGTREVPAGWLAPMKPQ